MKSGKNVTHDKVFSNKLAYTYVYLSYCSEVQVLFIEELSVISFQGYSPSPDLFPHNSILTGLQSLILVNYFDDLLNLIQCLQVCGLKVGMLHYV